MHQSIILTDLSHFEMPTVPNNASWISSASARCTARRALRCVGCLPCTCIAETRRHIVVAVEIEPQGESAAPWDYQKLATGT